jgi:rhodanese-related sulfurtransferase
LTTDRSRVSSISDRNGSTAHEPVAGADATRLNERNCIVLDLRPPAIFAVRFLSGSISASDERTLRLTIATMPAQAEPLYILGGSFERILQARSLLENQGYSVLPLSEDIISFPDGEGALGSIEIIEPERLAVQVLAWKTTVIDLRDPADFESGHTSDAINLPAISVPAGISGLPLGTHLTVLSDSTALSMYGASVLSKLGFRQLSVLRDGFAQYRERALPVARRARLRAT